MILKLKNLLAFFVLLMPLFIVSSPVLAQFNPTDPACSELTPTERAGATICNESEIVDDPVVGEEGVIIKVANVLSIAAGIIAVIIVVVAGIQMTLSTGDSQKVSNSRNAIIYTAVGILVIVLARTIVIFIVNSIG